MPASGATHPPPSLLIVDGYNLLHAVILKGRQRPEWWRSENQQRVMELVARYPGQDERWVVFDAARAASARLEPWQEQSGAKTQLWFAPDADAWILEQLTRLQQRSVVLVSADRSLQDRAQLLGAQRLSPWRFSATVAFEQADSLAATSARAPSLS